jgi:hypothetical protein
VSQQKSFFAADSEIQQKICSKAAISSQIVSDSLQSRAFGNRLPPEFNPSGSTLEGLRILQCIEWLRDRIIDGSLGHENEETEMVPTQWICFNKLNCSNFFFADRCILH